VRWRRRRLRRARKTTARFIARARAAYAHGGDDVEIVRRRDGKLALVGANGESVWDITSAMAFEALAARTRYLAELDAAEAALRCRP
jgi:hypothetical protein